MIPFLSFFTVFALYLHTLYPCIAPEDSGEFVTAAWTLGIPHASGYSLYVLLGKIATVLFPFGNPAYRVNILSALLGAGTLFFMVNAFGRLLPPQNSAATLPAQVEESRWRKTSLWLTALLWAMVPGVWYLSLLAEVYILELFLGMFALGCLIRCIVDDPLPRRVYLRRWGLFSFLVGIGLSVHHTLVLWLPGLLGFVLGHKRAPPAKPASVVKTMTAPTPTPFYRSDRAVLVCVSALLLAAGFSLQLYLLLRAHSSPLLNTGMPDNFVRWVRVLLRMDYGTFSLSHADAATSWVWGMKNYLLGCLHAFTFLGAPLLFWGMLQMARQSKSVFWGTVLLWFVPGPFFILIGRSPLQEHFQGVVERFYPLSFVGLALFLAWGIYDSGLRFAWFRRASFLLLPLSLLSHLWVNGRGNLHARDFGANLLRSLPPNSVLWDPGDTAAYAVLYQQTALGQRNDVASVCYHTTRWGQESLFQRYPDLLSPGTAVFQKNFLAGILNGPRREWVFVEVPKSLPGMTGELPQTTRYPEDGLPLGIAYRYFPAASHRLIEPNSQLSLAALNFWWYRRSAPWRLSPSSPLWRGEDWFTIEIVRRYAEAHTNLGQKFAQYGIHDAAEKEYILALAADPRQMEAYNNLGVLAYEGQNPAAAAVYFERALRQAPDNPSLYVNLGLSRKLAGENDKALEAFRAALRLDPATTEARYQLADLLEARRDYTGALDEWKELQRRGQDDKTVYWKMAQLHAALNTKNKALENLSSYFLFDLSAEEKTAAEEFRRSLLEQN
ncbi:MAG TPA: DUF2723 domain-containing protein [Elusimicrobiota bacterium]|nr:DUF2723 domain-containing protein [Elusimicrobiota bacterium]